MRHKRRKLGKRTCFLSVLTHLNTRSVVPGGAPSGGPHTFSQHGTGCISCRREASDVDVLNPTLLLVAIVDEIWWRFQAARENREEDGGSGQDASDAQVASRAFSVLPPSATCD